jgi:hypothetical protein
MKCVLLLLGFWAFGIESLHAQTTEPLLRRPPNALSSNRFYLGDERISRRKMGQLLQRENPEAYAEFSRARTQRALSAVTGLPGGLLVGYELGAWIGGERINAWRGGIGLGLFLASFIFTQNEESHLERAIALHNQRAGRLRVGPTTSGNLGLRMYF